MALGLEAARAQSRWTLFLLVGLGAILCLRLVALYWNTTDLFFDEAQYWAWGEEPAFGYYSKPPLIAWIIRAATEACGAGEACVRLPSPLLHTATALAVFLLGRGLYDARSGALSGSRIRDAARRLAVSRSDLDGRAAALVLGLGAHRLCRLV